MILEFHPAAELELAAAVTAGEEIATGLGAELSAETKRLVSLLCDLPRTGTPLVAGYRRFPLTRFPYALIYRTDGVRLQVVAVAHRRKQLNYWPSVALAHLTPNFRSSGPHMNKLLAAVIGVVTCDGSYAAAQLWR